MGHRIIEARNANRFFNLMHIVARQGMEVGLESLRIRSNGAPRKYESLPSKWVLLSRNGDRIAKLAQALPQAYEDMGLKAARMAVIHSKREALMHIRLWTDNFSNLLSQLKPL
ncbi:MAG: hypothetical protein IH881_17745 [Myxococcales bacterium]|nr:hypothetical protein [Myxococcales bacterium]